jgi:hypothetical protein
MSLDGFIAALVDDMSWLTGYLGPPRQRHWRQAWPGRLGLTDAPQATNLWPRVVS